MNFGETLGYWYLRLNGFFPIVDFVLHRQALSDGASADCDLLAVRFPHVYEEIGGQARDWDTALENDCGLYLAQKTIGLIVQVKTGGSCDPGSAFNRDRTLYGIQRLGFWNRGDADRVAGELETAPVYNDPRRPLTVGKLLIAENLPGPCARPSYVTIPLAYVDSFIVHRMDSYHDAKQNARIFFPSDLMQYIIWNRRENI